MEAIFGLALVSLITVLVLGLFPSAVRASAQAEDLNAALQLAREVMEQTRAQSVSLVAPLSAGPDTTVERRLRLNGVDSVRTFVYDVSVSDLSPPDVFKSVTVTVRWRVGALDRHLELETYIAAY